MRLAMKQHAYPLYRLCMLPMAGIQTIQDGMKPFLYRTKYGGYPLVVGKA